MSTPETKAPGGTGEKSSPPSESTKAPTASEAPKAPAPVVTAKKKSGGGKGLKIAILIVVVIVAAIFGGPWIERTLRTVSTDDAYVNGHVTFVAPRVGGQVLRVLVDDNNRVHKGDLLMELDPAPIQAQVNIAQAGVDAAQSDLVTARAQIRSSEGQVRSARFALEHAIEDVDNQVALLHSKVATLNSKNAILEKARDDYNRVLPLVSATGVTPQEIGQYKESVLVAQAEVDEALQSIFQIRVSLGLPAKPDKYEKPEDLTAVPDDLDQNFSAVREAQYKIIEDASQIGVVMSSFNLTPKQMIAEFYSRDPEGNLDRIYAKLVESAPAVKQAEAKVSQAQRNLEQAQLNLSYCKVYAEIDGVINRREVNPGNNVIPGQSVMAIRSLTDIWIDANFKETQLASLRIGQPVDIDVDAYGSKQQFKGRISGFTIGTGSTLALLPAENATGNFVKVVQRLPVRIDLIDYDPDKAPLFIGLSVTPYVNIKEQPAGPNAGKILQPYAPTTTQPAIAPTTTP